MTDARSLEHVRAVLRQHRGDLLRDYRAVGVGVGGPDDAGRYVITIYVHASTLPTEARDLEGVPLHFEATEQFQAQAPE